MASNQTTKQQYTCTKTKQYFTKQNKKEILRIKRITVPNKGDMKWNNKQNQIASSTSETKSQDFKTYKN